MLRVSAFFVLCATALALQSGSTANAADTWVLLATVEVDAGTGKAAADLTQAKGQFKAVRPTSETATRSLDSDLDSETRGIGGGPEPGPELTRSAGPAGGGGASGPASTTPPEQPNACIHKNL